VFGVPGRHHDKLEDNSLDALRPGGARRRLGRRAKRLILQTSQAVASRGVCHRARSRSRATSAPASAATSCGSEPDDRLASERWLSGQIQPSDGRGRKEALARWRPAEIHRHGDREPAGRLKLGYTARRRVCGLSRSDQHARAHAAKDSPSCRPRKRQDAGFRQAFACSSKRSWCPRSSANRDFLRRVSGGAREAVGCRRTRRIRLLRASVGTTARAGVAEDVHKLGLQQIDSLTAE